MNQTGGTRSPGRNRKPRLAPAILAIFLFIALVFIVAGAATNGVPGALFMAGIAIAVLGVAAVLRGRRTARGARRGKPLLAVGLIAATAGALLTTPSAGAPKTPTAQDQPTATTTESPPAPAPATQSPTTTSPALTAALNLQVKGRAPKTGYDRDLFGQAWLDVDRNGCDTRNDILGRDLTDLQFKPGTNDCKVLAGTLDDPYTDTVITFVNGATTSADIQIDHVVALSDAWQKGAQGWDTSKREHFANDPLNLLAVDGPTNQQKGDGDGATWLPPNKAYRCDYVARQVAVKAKYGAWVTAAEQDAIVSILADCPTQQLPADDAALPTAGPTTTPEPTATPEPSTATPTQANPPPTTETSPDTCLIKGNINSEGVHIYHVPGSRSYDDTQITESKGERWFCSTEEAEAAGWRAPRR